MMKQKVRKRLTQKDEKDVAVSTNQNKKQSSTIFPELSMKLRIFCLLVIIFTVIGFLFSPDIKHYWNKLNSADQHDNVIKLRTHDNDFKQQSQPDSPPQGAENVLSKSREKRTGELPEENNILQAEEYGEPIVTKETTGRKNDPLESEEIDTGSADKQTSSEQESTPIKLTPETMQQSERPSDPDRTKKSPSKKTRPGKEKKLDLPKEVTEFKATYLKKLTPKKVFIDGRRIPPVELLHQKPNNSTIKVYLFNEFLSDEECDALVRVHDKHVAEFSKEDPILCFDSISTLRKHLKAVKKKNVRVTPNIFTSGTTCVNASFSRQLKQWFNGNWSYSTAFYPGESRFSHVFSNRVKEAMGLSPENGGKFQITSYPQGIGYKTHTDCIVGSQDKRDRVATVLVYLKDVEEGGETKFTDLGIWVKPRKGRALAWTNMNEKGECEPASVHDASRVVKGQKYILQRWYYYQSFYSLGKRPPEPHLPIKKPGQPRVTCDEYDHGSCRWYDEWNYEHLLDYERQKHTLI